MYIETENVNYRQKKIEKKKIKKRRKNIHRCCKTTSDVAAVWLYHVNVTHVTTTALTVNPRNPQPATRHLPPRSFGTPLRLLTEGAGFDDGAAAGVAQIRIIGQGWM